MPPKTIRFSFGSAQVRVLHRIIEWFGLEGTLKIIWFQPPCDEQGHLPLDQVAQSSIQLALNTAREGAATASLGNLCQCLTTLIVKNFFLISDIPLCCPPLAVLANPNSRKRWKSPSTHLALLQGFSRSPQNFFAQRMSTLSKKTCKI